MMAEQTRDERARELLATEVMKRPGMVSCRPEHVHVATVFGREALRAIEAALTPPQQGEGIEQTAYNLIADEEEAEGFTVYAKWLRAGCPEDGSQLEDIGKPDSTEFRALLKALARGPARDGGERNG